MARRPRPGCWSASWSGRRDAGPSPIDLEPISDRASSPPSSIRGPDRETIGRPRPPCSRSTSWLSPASRQACDRRPGHLLNLLRDQLDRYGEIDAVEEQWVRDLAVLPSETALVICGDDPRVESIARRSGRRVLRFGMGMRRDGSKVRDAADMDPSARATDSPCPDCGTPVEFALGSSHGLGDWVCRACGGRRAELDLVVWADLTEFGWRAAAGVRARWGGTASFGRGDPPPADRLRGCVRRGGGGARCDALGLDPSTRSPRSIARRRRSVDSRRSTSTANGSS